MRHSDTALVHRTIWKDEGLRSSSRLRRAVAGRVQESDDDEEQEGDHEEGSADEEEQDGDEEEEEEEEEEKAEY